MSERHEIELGGCTPEPLMSYLKALGILRLVSEQADGDATGRWRNERFVLGSRLRTDDVTAFFLHEYCPSPICGPWAGGSGFFAGDNRRALSAIASTASSRFESYRQAIKRAETILSEEGITEKPEEELKARLLRRYRREMPDKFVEWMDAAMVLESGGQSFAPLLGTGGNDGRLDFTQNFMQRLVELGLTSGRPGSNATQLLRLCLFGEPTAGLGKAAVGQFAPGRAGGPNATQGMEGEATDNPWDFILGMEGTLMLSAAAVRRMGAQEGSRAAFPFTVRARRVGETGASDDELSTSRGEIWLPLWATATTRRELQAVFSEGRADIGGRPAQNALDFARAVAGLGIDRGIRAFVRYGFLRRSGKAYLASGMGRFRVPEQGRAGTDLLCELDAWLDGYRRACGGNEGPARLRTALHGIEEAAFGYCRYGREEDLRSILVALGQAERALAVTGGQRAGKELCQPCGGLSTGWLKATWDGTLEYEIALSLAGIDDRGSKAGPRRRNPLRRNLEPVVFEKGRWRWTELGREAVWTSANLVINMASALERRMREGAIAGREGAPVDFRSPAGLRAVAAFLAGEVDDTRIEDLLWGLVLVDHSGKYPRLARRRDSEAPPLPRAYALLKLLFLPRRLVRSWDANRQRVAWRLTRADEKEAGVLIRPEPRVLPLLRAGRVAEACRIAYQRLITSGLEAMPGPRRSGTMREGEWETAPGLDAHRLAAALLLPVGSGGVDRLVRLVIRQGEEQETHELP